jgi:ribosomal protein S18 acetylase RimI-like enzyme
MSQMTIERNYRELSDDQVKEFLIAHLAEFGDYELTLKDFEGRSIAIERWCDGFAIVLNPHTCDVQLWWLYVDAQHRGRKLGRRYMRQILAKYGKDWRMTLFCNVKLRAFYSSFGFRVIERDGEQRRMMMREEA